jgi:hypothetical protein
MKPESRIQQIPETMQGPYAKRKTSRKMAIIAMCQECTGYDRKAVRECTDDGCPLFHYRPYKVDQ